ncbi:MAG: ATP-binding cassette domain-containing protein [Pseudobdellovibrio sp.]
MNTGAKRILKIVFVERIHFKGLIILLSFSSALLGLAVPYYQKIFADNLNYANLAVCVGLALAYLASNQLALFVGQNESIQAQRKLSQVLYRHNLLLKPLTLQNRSVGEVVSLYATDVPSLTVWLEQSLPYGLTTVFPLVLTPVFLYFLYDLPLSFSFLLVVALVAMNSFLAYRQSIFFFRFKILAADRMGLVNEWIQNIRGLKILNWIEGFENKIIKKRREETVNRINMLNNGQIMNSVSSNMMFWLNIGMLSYFIWFYDKPLNKSDIIALLWVTTVFLARPLRQLPWFFTFVFDAWTSFNRLVDFVNLENTDEKIKSTTPLNPQNALEVKNLNLRIGDRDILKNINLTIQPHEMVALIGPVGSGKSLLIKSLIGETPFTADVFYKQHTSYLPQEHFIMSATLRDNMNFYYQSPKEHDKKVLHHLTQAQFNFELDRLHEGLETVVGERGVNLSGGQKQRVSLARQLMAPQNLLILDDPLSAVDISTESKMIDEFVKLKEENCSIILTTQRFTALPKCNRIIFLNNGQIEFDGSSQDFLTQAKYHSFIKGLI